VFDALPLCERSIVYETDRVEEFAPIKNADGLDSPRTSRELQIERAARWLQSAGVSVARDAEGKVAASLELPHLAAIEPDDLQDRPLPPQIKAGEERLL
jgi:UDP-N-acetylglucosamine/UDP-N-acetylgalactosamine diphosphorylase